MLCYMIVQCRNISFFGGIGPPNNLSMHCFDITSWTFTNFTYIQNPKAIAKAIQSTQFIANSCDKVITIDNGSWIYVHTYVVEF
jgi:hypothetical protein